uniref:Uncharacterized protein n=1 Tax=Romanomermis culicivorax TaxID=13658 RepID=A0A915IS34_ROMCU
MTRIVQKVVTYHQTMQIVAKRNLPHECSSLRQRNC